MYDLVIIGLGPAGLTAAIYACCFKLNHVTLGTLPGGQMTFAPDILNYPGFEEISGGDLTMRMVKQLEKRGGSAIMDTVGKIEKTAEGYSITTQANKIYATRTIILATGVERRKLNVPGESQYTGKGVQYCASCERFDYEGKVTAVVGGANAAAQTAIQLSHAAKKVYIIHRGAELRADPIWLSQIEKIPHIEVIYNARVSEISGDGEKMTSVTLSYTDGQTNQHSNPIPVDKLYIEIGGVPGTALLLPLGAMLDEKGFINVSEKLETSLPGIFACGDVITHKHSVEQISSAVGSGALAAVSAFSYLKENTAPSLWGTALIQRPTK